MQTHPVPFNRLIPELIVSSMPQSMDFYHGIMGFRVEYERTEDSFAFLSYHGSQLMLEQGDEASSLWKIEPLDYPRGRGINLSIESPDVRELESRIVAAGISVRLPTEERWYRSGESLQGERHFLVQDPDGYLLRFCQSLGQKPF